jgi:hypothetical protein
VKKERTVLEIAQGKLPPTEKQEQGWGDRFMHDLDFTSIHFSQARASQQTPGIPDRKYYSPFLGLTFWWEAKAEDGKQSEDQRKYQIMCQKCGELYVLGTAAVLGAWVVERIKGLRTR